jgi:hypothetical protein
LNKQENNQNKEQSVDAYHDEGEIIIPKIELRGHNWKQKGYTIICESCPLRHAHYIGSDFKLIKIEDGIPKFARRK